MTVANLLQELDAMPHGLPIYGSCCGIVRVDPGIAVVNLIAPCIPGQPQETRYTVAALATALEGVDGTTLLYVNGKPAQLVGIDEDDHGTFADVWAG